jgi:hypothetical protein
MDLNSANKIAAFMVDLQRLDLWFNELKLQDISHSNSVRGFMSEAFSISVQTAAEIRTLLRGDLVSQRVRLVQELTKLGVEMPGSD